MRWLSTWLRIRQQQPDPVLVIKPPRRLFSGFDPSLAQRSRTRREEAAAIRQYAAQIESKPTRLRLVK